VNTIDGKALLDALRRVGVAIPNQPTVVSSRPIETKHSETKYWYIVSKHFETMVDSRDAATEEEAIEVAKTALHPWYVLDDKGVEIVGSQTSRKFYIEWLQRGVR
jgi:hypothetical protein